MHKWMSEWMNVEHLRNNADGKIKMLWVKLAPLPLFALQIPHLLTWDWDSGHLWQKTWTDCLSHSHEFAEKCVNANNVFLWFYWKFNVCALRVFFFFNKPTCCSSNKILHSQKVWNPVTDTEPLRHIATWFSVH